MPISKCDLKAHARKVREARKMRKYVATPMRPLFNHILKLSIHSAKTGYCQRAGAEVARAKKMGRPW